MRKVFLQEVKTAFMYEAEPSQLLAGLPPSISKTWREEVVDRPISK